MSVSTDTIYEIGPPADWVRCWPLDGLLGSDEGSPLHFPLVDYQEYISDKEIHSYKKTYQVVNDASHIENASLILTELHEGSQCLIIHALHIVRGGQVIDALDPDNISAIQRENQLESHITSNRITVSISVDDLRVGDHLAFSSTAVERQNQHPLMGKHFSANYGLTWGCPVKLQALRVVNQSSADITVLHGMLDESCIENYRRETVLVGDTFEVVHRDLVASQVPNVAPEWFWDDFIQVTSTTTWAVLSHYLYQYYLEADALTGDINLAAVDLLEIDNQPLENQGIAIIRFVQNNIRYKGENEGVFTHMPKNPERTLKKRAGDCKDKSNLMVAMLNTIGIEACLVLVNTRYGEKMSTLNPSPYHFNHMVVQVRINDRVYYVDATIQKQGGDFSHMAQLDYGYGLPLADGGSELVEINRDISQKVFLLEHTFDFSRAAGEQELRVKRTFYQHRADNMRSYFSSTQQSKFEQDFCEWAKSDTGLELKISAPVHIIRDDLKMNELVSSESYTIASPVQIKNGNIGLLTDFYKDFPVPNSDHYPIRVDLDGSVKHKIIAHYKWAPNMVVSAKEITTEVFSYSDTVQRDKGKITFTVTAKPHKKYVSADSAKQHKGYIEEMRLRSVSLIPYRLKVSIFDLIRSWFK